MPLFVVGPSLNNLGSGLLGNALCTILGLFPRSVIQEQIFFHVKYVTPLVRLSLTPGTNFEETWQ